MAASDIPKPAVFTRVVYWLGLILALLGALAVMATSFLVWQISVYDEHGAPPQVAPFYGSSLAFVLGAVGLGFVLVLLITHDNPPTAAFGSLLGWWLAAGGVILISATGSLQARAGIVIAMSGVGAGLLGSVLLLLAGYRRLPVARLPLRHWFAALALLVALATPGCFVLAGKLIKQGPLEGDIIPGSIGLVILALALGAAALYGAKGAALPYRYRIMGGMAISLAAAECVDTYLVLVYVLQNFKL